MARQGGFASRGPVPFSRWTEDTGLAVHPWSHHTTPEPGEQASGVVAVVLGSLQLVVLAVVVVSTGVAARSVHRTGFPKVSHRLGAAL